MKIVKADQTKEFKNSDACTAIEYPLGDPDINGAIVKLNGRYPERGYVTNEVCKELVYVIEGSGTLSTDTSSQQLAQGDVALLFPGEKYYFQGKLKMFMPCTPTWYPAQHKQVES